MILTLPQALMGVGHSVWQKELHFLVSVLEIYIRFWLKKEKFTVFLTSQKTTALIKKTLAVKRNTNSPNARKKTHVLWISLLYKEQKDVF